MNYYAGCWTALIYWIQQTAEIVAEYKLPWSWNTLFYSGVHVIWRLKTRWKKSEIFSLDLVKFLPGTRSWSWKCECMLIAGIVAFLSPCIIIQTTCITWKVACHECWQRLVFLLHFVCVRFDLLHRTNLWKFL